LSHIKHILKYYCANFKNIFTSEHFEIISFKVASVFYDPSCRRMPENYGFRRNYELQKE
jgi:hypothetical protein